MNKRDRGPISVTGVTKVLSRQQLGPVELIQLLLQAISQCGAGSHPPVEGGVECRRGLVDVGSKANQHIVPLDEIAGHVFPKWLLALGLLVELLARPDDALAKVLQAHWRPTHVNQAVQLRLGKGRWRVAQLVQQSHDDCKVPCAQLWRRGLVSIGVVVARMAFGDKGSPAISLPGKHFLDEAGANHARGGTPLAYGVRPDALQTVQVWE